MIHIILLLFAAKNRVVSPPRHAPTKLLHVNHLTRPFTKGQLFEILTEDGPIVQEMFWTNRIKSHCIALVRGGGAEGEGVDPRGRGEGGQELIQNFFLGRGKSPCSCVARQYISHVSPPNSE